MLRGQSQITDIPICFGLRQAGLCRWIFSHHRLHSCEFIRFLLDSQARSSVRVCCLGLIPSHSDLLILRTRTPAVNNPSIAIPNVAGIIKTNGAICPFCSCRIFLRASAKSSARIALPLPRSEVIIAFMRSTPVSSGAGRIANTITTSATNRSD